MSPRDLDRHEVRTRFRVVGRLSRRRQVTPGLPLAIVGSNTKGLRLRHLQRFTFPPFQLLNLGPATSAAMFWQPDTMDSVVHSGSQFGRERVEAIVGAFEAGGTESIDGSALLVRHPGERIYGHWLLDLVPKILLAEPVLPNDAVFVISKAAPAYVEDLIRLGGGDPGRILRIEPEVAVRTERALWITPTRCNQYVHPLIREVRRRFVGESRPSPADRLFVSRTRWVEQKGSVHRSLLNRHEVEQIASEAGYEVFRPEEYSLEEQIARFSRCRAITGEDGSGLHNSLFAHDGCEVLNLRSSKNHSLIQGSLCAALGQRIRYVLGPVEDETRGRESSFHVDVDLVRRQFEEMP